MQKIFNLLIRAIAKIAAAIVTSSWYRDSVRASGLSERKFACNALLSLAMLLALGVIALAAR